MKITESRLQRLNEVVRRRQLDLTVILENVHDIHNIGAVMRSCDAVGIREVYVLYTEPHLTPSRFKIGKKTSSGARKWLDFYFFRDAAACFAAVRKKYDFIYAAMPSDDARGLWSLDLTQPVALLFGNERDGVSPEARALCDGDFFIPMAGMAQSLNISVACAVSLYEAYRQRSEAGMYADLPNGELSPGHQLLLEDYLRRHEEDGPVRLIRSKDSGQ